MKKYVVIACAFKKRWIAAEFEELKRAKAFAKSNDDLNKKYGNDASFYVLELVED